ncbi:MAG: ribulokinase [Clostridia bacterium]|nr:ribulokinase [Clostridia bacterium]
MKRCAIGLDYGTLSVRAVLTDIFTGDIAAESVFEYPHGVMDRLPGGEQLPPGWALQHPLDYTDGLRHVVRGVMKESGISPEAVVSVGLCATSATILPVTEDLTPLCLIPAFENEPHAWMKLWKHHAAEPEAALIGQTARERGESWLDAYGGRVSAEWAVPKILETLRHAPRVYDGAYRFLDVMDFLTCKLTGKLTASGCSMGYKAFYRNGQFPDPMFYRAVDPRLEDLTRGKMGMPVSPVGTRAGTLTAAMASELGLEKGTPVGTPLIDGHASLPGCGVTKPGTLVIVMGTSACHLILSEKDASIPGIQGTVKDGIMPGYYGIEAGQTGVGDLFGWAAENCLTEAYVSQAREKGIDAHRLLTEKLAGYRPGKSGLIALDWFNGVRTPLMDYDLSGLILGITLSTKPEDIYLALMEANAFGTRGIVELFERAGVHVDRIVLAGGIPEKNPLVPQICADVLGRPVERAKTRRASAMGAAAAGIAAAPKEVTGCAGMADAVERLARKGRTFLPRLEHTRVYNGLYADYMTLQDTFGRGGNDVMKRLSRLRRE